jgi:hypothetical protein
MHNRENMIQENKDIHLKISEIENSLKDLEQREIETVNLIVKLKQV